MAGTSGILSSSEQIQANYEKYKSKFKDATEKMVNSDTFLSLLVAEMTNQDPMEPTSNTEFVSRRFSIPRTLRPIPSRTTLQAWSARLLLLQRWTAANRSQRRALCSRL